MIIKAIKVVRIVVFSAVEEYKNHVTRYKNRYIQEYKQH
jgi:hypothetical protein